jgi:hypothetical protein
MGFMRTNEAMNAAAFPGDEERWAAFERDEGRGKGDKGLKNGSALTPVFDRPNYSGHTRH